MTRFSFGLTPDEVIRSAAREQCPGGYPMLLRGQEEWAALSEAWNQGIDSYLEAITERSSADSSTGAVVVHPDELHALLRRLRDDDYRREWSSTIVEDAGLALRSAILTTLGIEEV